jgi:hypothetical protein
VSFQSHSTGDIIDGPPETDAGSESLVGHTPQATVIMLSTDIEAGCDTARIGRGNSIESPQEMIPKPEPDSRHTLFSEARTKDIDPLDQLTNGVGKRALPQEIEYQPARQSSPGDGSSNMVLSHITLAPCEPQVGGRW